MTPNEAREKVSIHAPRMEGDSKPKFMVYNDDPVSIHAPRMEGDRNLAGGDDPGNCFNPRPPDGGRRAARMLLVQWYEFQSTPPGWRATAQIRRPRRADWFQSTPPGWRATLQTVLDCTLALVSIHAPRMEGDYARYIIQQPYTRFNPRPPDGGRLSAGPASRMSAMFQSTPPGWRATD